jgi:cation transport ATPase
MSNKDISNSSKIDISSQQEESKEEFKIDQILEETHYITEQDAMKKAAEKYGARPEMDEIFSNADKQIRLTNKNPLDIDKENVEEIPAESEEVVDSKTAATIEAQIIMDSPVNDEDREEIVNLTPDIPEGAKIAEDVIEDSEEFSEVNPETGTVFNMDEKHPENTENKKSEKAGNYEKIFGVKKPSPEAKTVQSRVPVYQQSQDTKEIHVKAGRFSQVVKGEYEQYLRSKNPSISQVIKTEIKKTENAVPEEKDTRSRKEKILSAVVGIFSGDNSDDTDIPVEQVEPVDDYRNKEDATSILYELNLNIKKLFTRSFVMSIVTFISLVLVILVKAIPTQLTSAIGNAPVVYAVINLILTGVVIFINRITIYSGLTPLAKLKGNSDTALAVGAIGAGVQSIVSLFCLVGVTTFSINYYTIIVTIGFLCNCIGKLFMVLRIKDNFKFISSETPSHAVKIYTNEEIAKKMMSGTVFDRPIVVYQHKTKFLSNFLKMSYAPDPSEDLAGKIAPVTIICSLAVAIIYGAMYGTFAGAVDTFAVMSAVSIPLCTLIAVNIPMRYLCKKLNEQGAVISGYPSVKQFCDSNAIMIDANDIYPRGSVKLDGIKTFANHRIDESVLAAAAILKEAKSPMAAVFNEAMLHQHDSVLPEVESVLYEDNMGLIGRVKGQRVLVGNRALMQKYNIETPSEDYEEKYHIEGRQITYLAQAGELISMFVTTYTPEKSIAQELQRGEANGLCYLIRTTDCNITSERVAEDFGLFFRSVKVLPTGLGNVCMEAQSQQEETSRAYLGTRGKLSSLVRGVSGCIRIKSNISLTVVIQLIAVVLGLLLVATLCLYATNAVLGTVEILVYCLFWALAAVIAPAIQKP